MVTEFTELQGEMGKEYALLDGEKANVAQAIFEQYMPRFAGDILPQQPIGRALSLADKLDNLAATFLRGLIPTGSQDPFALRRQTIGAVNILVDGKIHWDVREGIAKALALLPGTDEAKRPPPDRSKNSSASASAPSFSIRALTTTSSTRSSPARWTTYTPFS